MKLRSSRYGAQWLLLLPGSCSRCCCSGSCSRSNTTATSSTSGSSCSNGSRDSSPYVIPDESSGDTKEDMQQQRASPEEQQQKQTLAATAASQCCVPLLLPPLLPAAAQTDLRGGSYLPQLLLKLLVSSPHPASVFLSPAVHAVGVLLLLLHSYRNSSSTKVQQLLRAIVGETLLQKAIAALQSVAAAIALAASPSSSSCSKCGCCCPLPLPVQHTLLQLLLNERIGRLPSRIATARRAAATAPAAADGDSLGATAALGHEDDSGGSSKRKRRALCSSGNLNSSRCCLNFASDATSEAASEGTATTAATAEELKLHQTGSSSKRPAPQILIIAEDSPYPRSVYTHCGTTGCSSTPTAAAHRQQYNASPFSPWANWSVNAALNSKEASSLLCSQSPCCYTRHASTNHNSNNSSSSNTNCNNEGGQQPAQTGARPRRPRRWDVEAPIQQ